MALTGGGNVGLGVTVLFAAVGAWYLAAVVRALRRPENGNGRRIPGFVMHILMSVAMIGMFWSWGADIPVIAQVTVFTAATGWFAARALFPAAGHHGGGSNRNWYHAGMMAAMVWMAVAMPLMSATPANAGMTGMSMAGMDMSGQAPAAAAAVGTIGPAAGSAGWARTVCLVLAAALFAAALWQAVAALRPLAAPGPERTPGPSWRGVADVVLRDSVSALMAVGMAVALLEIS